MPHDLADLKTVKAAAKAEFAKIDGVLGVGIGDNTIRVYVRNEEASKKLPDAFRGVTIEPIYSGDITAR